MNTKKWILIGSTLIIVIVFFLSLSLKRIYEYIKLKEEVIYVLKYVEQKDASIIGVQEKLKERITIGRNMILERSIESYIIDLSSPLIELNKISNDLEKVDLFDEGLNKKFTIYKNRIKEVKSSLDSIDSENYIKKNTSDIYIIKKYNRFINNRASTKYYKEKANSMLTDIEFSSKLSNFYISHKGKYKIEEDTIVFIKRNSFNLYSDLLKEKPEDYKIKLLKYKLVDDTTPPTILAADLTLVQGTAYDLASNIKCVDDVDDEVACTIQGTYDTNKLGTYKINIISKDKSDNQSSKTIYITVKEPYKTPYYIEVIRNQNTVLIYGLDSKKQYTRLIKVFPCSTGANNATPVGLFSSSKGVRWGTLYGGVYGQYSTRIVGNVLFHSVPYSERNNSSLKWQYYNFLGQAASMGCIRLTVADAKWIYDNCEPGTPIRIHDGNLPAGISKPTAIKIDSEDPRRGWDPTDPDPNNPWHNS